MIVSSINNGWAFRNWTPVPVFLTLKIMYSFRNSIMHYPSFFISKTKHLGGWKKSRKIWNFQLRWFNWREYFNFKLIGFPDRYMPRSTCVWGKTKLNSFSRLVMWEGKGHDISKAVTLHVYIEFDFVLFA